MASSGRKVDRRAGKKALSEHMSRSGYPFVSGEDASKLALVLERVRAGTAPTPEELDALRFENPTARDVAAALVRDAVRPAPEDRPHRRRAAAG